MIGIAFGVILPLIGVWITTSVLSAAAEDADRSHS